MPLLDIVKEVDKFTYDTQSPSYIYRLKTHDNQATLGYIIPSVATELLRFPEFVTLQNTNELVINPNLTTFEQRNEVVAKVALQLRSEDKFVTLRGWRDELYTAHYPSKTPYLQSERAFSPLLGICMYGIHINGYIQPSTNSEEVNLWVPRRAKNKATFPGMLDNTIAGGLGGKLGPWDTAVKESYEEAGVSEDYIQKNLKQAGVVSYIFVNDDEGGLIQPELEYVYDLVFDKDTVPQPIDGEVQEFYLMPLSEVLERLEAREFKPNCALVIIDFLMRHSFIKADSEADYIEIVSRLHRRLPFPTR